MEFLDGRPDPFSPQAVSDRQADTLAAICAPKVRHLIAHMRDIGTGRVWTAPITETITSTGIVWEFDNPSDCGYKLLRVEPVPTSDQSGAGV